MTRKKSRPQHRETSPKSANEGGFYKMFWNSMEGDNDASAFPPNERPANSPTVIIINDSDDENPYIIDENSGDVPFIPHPIKQEVFVDAQTSAGETVEDQSAVVQLEKTPETIEDCVSETLQPTPPVHLTESCDESINSSRLVADQTSENVVLSPNRANSPKESFPVPHDPSNAPENDIDAERTVDNYESSPLKTIIPSGSQQQENGYQCRDSEVTQVCSIFSPNQLDDPPGDGCSISLDSPTVAVENKCEGDGIPINGHLEATTNSPPVMSRTTGHDLESTQVDHPSGDGCSVSLDSAMVAIENRCEGDEISTNGNLEAITNSPPVMSVTTGQGLESNQVDEPLGNDCSVSLDSAMLSIENRCEGEEMSTNSSLEAITNSPPVMSRTTGQALELLKSLLVSPDGEASSVSTPVNTESNVDIDSSTEPRSMPIVNPLQIKREIGESQCLISNVTLSSNEPNTACLDDTASSVVQSIASHFESSAVVQPTTVTQQTQSADICKDSAADEFPAFGLVLPSKIKIESDCVKRSLDLLKNELFNFYNNCHVKIAFERKTELEIAEKSLDVLNNEEVEPRIPNGTAPCRVMMERLPTPLVRKGYVALSCKAFQTWKSRIIRLRNEEQFRHLGVWRRGRTRLWRECQLAGMDKLSYDEQVVYIKKHMIYETSSSSEADSSDDEFYNKMFDPESDNNKLHPNDLSPPALITTVHSVDTTSADDVTKSKSPLSKGKVKGSKSMKNQYRSKAINVPKTPDNDVSPCRDEYVVEQSTVHDPHSGGKKTAPLKITIRKTSVNKSEDEREKSVESEVENSFTVPLKPTNKKVKRNFVTKRTYRKLEDQVLPQPDTLIDNEQQKKRRVQPTPHYVDDNDEDEESLLGRRSYEVENFNLLEKWDIPFEEPTLFRSPRMASRLAQLKTKEAFTRKIRAQPAPQKPVLLCKEVKEVVEMLCSKTVEAMLCPDATTSAQQAPNSGTPLQIKCLVLDTPSVPLAVQSEEVPPHNIPETEDISGKTTCDEDMSETQSVTHDETNSTIDTSECGDSPMKGKIVSPVSKKRKKPKLSYRRKKAKAKPSLKTVDTPLNDEKVIELCSKVPKVLISPLQSTQVPVVSEGPGQSPQESEDDAMHPVNTEAVKNNVSANVENEKLQDALDEVDERSAEKSDHVSRVQNTLPDLPVPPVDNEKGTTTRVTRSKQPSITLDPDILENFGIRKKSKKSVDRKNTSSEDMGNEIKSTRQPVKSIPKKKGALPKKSLQEIPVEGKNSDLNTQVHEVSEGPGEVTEELSMKQLPPNIPSQDDCASVVEELENIGSGKDIRVNPNKIIPDSPMSPTPDAVEDEPVQPRMTRSKKRMMREGYAYIALKMNNSNEDGLPADEPVTKLNAETVQLEVGSSEKVSETVCETQQASLDGDKSGTGSLVDSVKTSTDIAEETVENVTALDSCPVLAEEIPVIQEKPCLETDKHLVVQPQPELVTKTSSSDVDDPSLAIAQQISVSIASLIHRPEEIGALDTITPSLPSGATQPKPPENVFTNEVSPNKTPEEAVSLVTEGSSSPVEPNTSRETKAQAVLETLNSILKLSSQNKKIADSLTSRGNINLFDKEPTIEFRNASDDECDSGDAADGLVVDEDRDFSDDDDNSADLATRIDQIIKDQIKGDTEPTGVKGLSEAETGNVKSKEIASKSRDSIDERTGLPTAFIQKLRDPRIRSKLLSRLEESDELVPNEALASLSVNRADPLKAPLNDKPSTAIRDPRTLRTVTVTRPVLATASVGVTGDQTVVRTVPLVEGGAMEPPVSRESANGAAVMRGAPNPVALSGALSPQAILRGATTTSALRAPLLPTPTSAPLLNNPRGPLLPTPTSAPLLNNPRGPLLPTPTVVPLLPTPAALLNKPRGPLLPTPTALHPMARALSNSASAVYPLSIDRTGIASTNEVVEQNKIDEDDEDEEESLKRRPKKQKKELDTELMYKSPLEDLQSEAHPTYGRQLPRVNSRSDRRNITRIERGRSKSTERRASRWDVRYNEEDHRHYPEPHPVYNQDRWGVRQMNDQVSPIPSDPHSWKPRNWHPEYNTSYLPPHPNEIVYQEPRLSYMDTKLLNLSLLPKTTNLSAPPFTKIYTYFNHSNPQILGIAPPTYDPNEKASTITMMDPMGQEMIDIVQLPRPTSGLTSDYFNDLPDEFSLEELVTHPYLALSDMMDEEIEIENHGTNIFDDSDEERRISRVNVASRRLVNDPRNRPPVLHEKTDNVKDKQPQKLTTGNPLENILHCLPALKEQYSFKKTAVDLENENSGEPIAPPPPIWSNDLDLRKKDKKPEKTRPVEANETVLKNWRNPSPPKMKPSTKTHSPTNRSRSKSPPHRKMRRRSRSKSPARRRSKSRSRSPRSRRRSRSRSPYGVRRSTRSRSSSPKYRRGRSRSSSVERLGHVRKFKRSRSRSPAYHHHPASISPSRKRHSRR